MEEIVTKKINELLKYKESALAKEVLPNKQNKVDMKDIYLEKLSKYMKE